MLFHLQPNGPFTFTTGAAAIEENVLVEQFTDGTLIKCGAARMPVGFVQWPYAIGVTATVYQAIGEALIKAGAAFAIGDYLKTDANGRLICNGVTGATVNDILTVAQAESAATANGDFAKVFFKP
jgi:Uncharacterized conserved protein (DUF2190)